MSGEYIIIPLVGADSELHKVAAKKYFHSLSFNQLLVPCSAAPDSWTGG